MPAAEDAYRADRAEARAARGIGEPAIAQGRAAISNGDARFTAPSLLFRRDGQTLVAGGWQSFEAYDVCVANLAPELDRRPEPQPAELLAAFPAGLTTAEVAEVCRGRNDPRDIPATRAALERLRESGAATGTPLGDDDVLWRPRACPPPHPDPPRRDGVERRGQVHDANRRRPLAGGHRPGRRGGLGPCGGPDRPRPPP